MAQLVREVMEKADTLDEAVEIMRKGPRTCEYYYVISDGKAKRAVGIAATPEKLRSHPARRSPPATAPPGSRTPCCSVRRRPLRRTRPTACKDGYGKFNAEIGDAT